MAHKVGQSITVEVLCGRIELSSSLMVTRKQRERPRQRGRRERERKKEREERKREGEGERDPETGNWRPGIEV